MCGLLIFIHLWYPENFNEVIIGPPFQLLGTASLGTFASVGILTIAVVIINIIYRGLQSSNNIHYTRLRFTKPFKTWQIWSLEIYQNSIKNLSKLFSMPSDQRRPDTFQAMSYLDTGQGSWHQVLSICRKRKLLRLNLQLN